MKPQVGNRLKQHGQVPVCQPASARHHPVLTYDINQMPCRCFRSFRIRWVYLDLFLPKLFAHESIATTLRFHAEEFEPWTAVLMQVL